jgi:hypothetical protein
VGYKDGKEKVFTYQFAGESESGIVPTPATQVFGDPSNWRCLFVSKLADVVLVPGEWHSAANHSSSQTCIDEVAEEISY